MTVTTLEKTAVKPVILVTGQRKDEKTQMIKPVAHEVKLPVDMDVSDLLAGVKGSRARSVSVQPIFRHANPHSREETPVIGKEYEIIAYKSDWQTEGELSAMAYDIEGSNPESVAAFVEKYKC